LLLRLWACGQRSCVVHHVHSLGGDRIVVTLEIPKATLRKMQRFLQALLAITVAE
jgi:hypothetical protein